MAPKVLQSDYKNRTGDLPVGVANKVLAQDRLANPPPVGKAMVAGMREAIVLVYKACE